MEFLSIYAQDHLLMLAFDCRLILGLALLAVLATLLRYCKGFRRGAKVIEVDEFTLGIGNSQIKLRVDRSDRIVAYRIWVELMTRKIGLPFDADNDVISQVYDSWYEAFRIIREHIKDLPPGKSDQLADLSIRILNHGLRPHLTQWQVKYREWYRQAADGADFGQTTPQELQREYPSYKELVFSLAETHARMSEFTSLLRKVFKED